MFKPLLAILAAFGLSACEQRSLAPNFCEAEGRQIPDKELKALLLVDMRRQGDLPAYLENRIRPNAPEAEAFDALIVFVEQNPLCCQFVQADLLGDRAFVDQSNNGEPLPDAALKRMVDAGYIGDFAVFGEASPRFQKVPWKISKPFRGQMILGTATNCGRFQGYDDRG